MQYAISRNGVELVAPTWIERERVYRIDRGNIVGSSEEQSILEREMLRDVAGQIIRAMSAVSRNATQAQTDVRLSRKNCPPDLPEHWRGFTWSREMKRCWSKRPAMR